MAEQIDYKKLNEIAETKGKDNRAKLLEKCTEEEIKEYRSIREEKRGIVRDSHGRIIVTKNTLRKRLRAQRERKIDYEKRIKNINDDLKYLKEQLSGDEEAEPEAEA